MTKTGEEAKKSQTFFQRVFKIFSRENIWKTVLYCWHILSLKWVPDFLYNSRHTLFPWLILFTADLALAYYFLWFYKGQPFNLNQSLSAYLFPTQTENTTPSPENFLTFLAGLLAVPYLWYIWLIRNRDKHQEIIDKHEDQRLDARRLWTEQLNKAVEWATDPSNRSRQAAAIQSLRGYVSRDICQLPQELRGDHNPFRHIVEGVIVSVSQETGGILERLDIVWKEQKEEERTATEKELQVLQCRMAIETLVQESWEGGKAKNLPQSNFAFMTIFNADLRGADLPGAAFERTDLQGANLQGANLKGAALIRTGLQNTRGLTWAQIQHANYFEADSIPPYLQEEIRANEHYKKEFEDKKIAMQKWKENFEKLKARIK